MYVHSVIYSKIVRFILELYLFKDTHIVTKLNTCTVVTFSCISKYYVKETKQKS